MTIHAHYDGRVFVPDEPVDLPTNESVVIEVTMPQYATRPAPTIAQREEAIRRLLSRAVNADIPDGGLRRESIYEDR